MCPVSSDILVPHALNPQDTNSTLVVSMGELSLPAQGRARVGTGGDRCTLTSNLQPDFRRGIAQLIDSSAGIDASIPLLGHRDPQRPSAGALGSQNHLKIPWSKDKKVSCRCPWSPWEARVSGCLSLPDPGLLHLHEAGAWGWGSFLPKVRTPVT